VNVLHSMLLAVKCNHMLFPIAKLVLITNRKSLMSFRLVSNSVTLDDLERCNSRNRRVISPNSVAFGADYIKVVEDTSILSAAEM